MTKAQEHAAAVEARKRAAYTRKARTLLGHVWGRVVIRDFDTAYLAGKTAEAFAAEVASREPVGAAVHVLKAAAVARAEEQARNVISRVLADLEAHGWDLRKAAPYPRWNEYGSDYERRAKQAKHSLYSRLTRSERGSRSLNEPDLRSRCEESEEHFVTETRESAAIEYDAFIVKLVEKVGPDVLRASLEGDHVWSRSVLTVTKGHGGYERWQTTQIVNQTKYGMPYNQWPTRRLSK